MCNFLLNSISLLYLTTSLSEKGAILCYMAGTTKKYVLMATDRPFHLWPFEITNNGLFHVLKKNVLTTLYEWMNNGAQIYSHVVIFVFAFDFMHCWMICSWQYVTPLRMIFTFIMQALLHIFLTPIMNKCKKCSQQYETSAWQIACRQLLGHKKSLLALVDGVGNAIGQPSTLPYQRGCVWPFDGMQELQWITLC